MSSQARSTDNLTGSPRRLATPRPDWWLRLAALVGGIAGLALGMALMERIQRGGVSATEVWVFVAMLSAAFVGLGVRHRRRVQRFQSENGMAVAALHNGEIEAAREQFQALALRWRRPRALNLVALFNLGTAELLAGDLGRARDHLAQVEVELGRNVRRGLAPHLPGRLAYVQALLGDLGDARAWLAASRERGANDGVRSEASDVWEIMAESILDCRSNLPASAAARLAERWFVLESAGLLLAPAHVVRAFGIHLASAGAEASEIVRMLAPARERAAPRRENNAVAHLGVAWPEMQAFLVDSELV